MVAELLLEPKKTKEVADCTDVACGAEFTMWLCDGRVFSAGLPQYGQLGHGTDHEYNAKDCKISMSPLLPSYVLDEARKKSTGHDMQGPNDVALRLHQFATRGAFYRHKAIDLPTACPASIQMLYPAACVCAARVLHLKGHWQHFAAVISALPSMHGSGPSGCSLHMAAWPLSMHLFFVAEQAVVKHLHKGRPT